MSHNQAPISQPSLEKQRLAADLDDVTAIPFDHCSYGELPPSQVPHTRKIEVVEITPDAEEAIVKVQNPVARQIEARTRAAETQQRVGKIIQRSRDKMAFSDEHRQRSR
ncbi:MAG TPA: hypothetical protein VF575_05095 [Candidatus Saccharimonadales bacterium]|jgi:hypothetical protein